MTKGMTAMLVYTTKECNFNCTDNYDVAKIKMKSVTDHQ